MGSIVDIVLFGDDGELFLGSEVIAYGAGGYGGDRNNEKGEGKNVDLHRGGDSQEGSVQVTADGVGYAVKIYRPLGSGELSVCVFHGVVDAEIADGGSNSQNIVGDICRETDPDTVEGASLKSLSLDADLILCSDIPHIGIDYKKVKQYGECADAHYDGIAFRKLRNGVEEQTENGERKLVHE